MKTIMLLLFKFVVNFAAAWAAFVYYDLNSMNWVLSIALSGTVLNFLLGDLVILPSMGNWTASIGDGVIAASVAYVIDIFASSFMTSATGLIIFAAIIALAEYFFHMYMKKDEKEGTDGFDREPPIE